VYEEEVRELSKARQDVAGWLAIEQDFWTYVAEAHPEYERTRQSLKVAKDRAKALEDALRTKVGNRYECMGEEPDHSALGLRQYAEPKYDEQAAVGLCIAHNLHRLLELNYVAFQHVAPTLWPEFGDFGHKRVVVTIKGDLSKWAGGDGEDSGAEGA